MIRRAWTGAVVALVTGAVLVLPAYAIADQGVAINLGSITIEEPLERGESYRLPAMEVTNPGTEASAYEVAARPVTGPDQLELSNDWFVIVPTEFTLEPGATQPVSIALNIPDNAQSGIYAGLIGPSIVPAGGGASVGAGAAAKLTFEIPPDPTSLSSRATEVMDSHARWVYGAIVLLVLVALVVMLGRRFAFRIERK